MNNLPSGEVSTDKFAEEYQKHFGRCDFKVTYGFKRLTKLFNAIPDTVTVVENENLKVVRLTNSASLSHTEEPKLCKRSDRTMALDIVNPNTWEVVNA